MSDQTPGNIDAFHWHEALDRTFICMKMMDTLLLSHPVFEQNSAFKEKAQEAHHLLFELCQEIGKRNLND